VATPTQLGRLLNSFLFWIRAPQSFGFVSRGGLPVVQGALTRSLSKQVRVSGQPVEIFVSTVAFSLNPHATPVPARYISIPQTIVYKVYLSYCQAVQVSPLVVFPLVTPFLQFPVR